MIFPINWTFLKIICLLGPKNFKINKNLGLFLIKSFEKVQTISTFVIACQMEVNMINFRKISEENFNAIIKMKRPEGEGYMAHHVSGRTSEQGIWRRTMQ